MSKKIFILISSLFFNSTVLANGGTLVPLSTPSSGFYIGGDLGGDSSSYRNALSLSENAILSIIFTSPDITVFENFNQVSSTNFSKSSQAVDGGLFVGYKFASGRNLFFALEGFGDLSSNKGSWSQSFAGTNPNPVITPLLPHFLYLSPSIITLMFQPVFWVI